jgi:hypothetical protein
MAKGNDQTAGHKKHNNRERTYGGSQEHLGSIIIPEREIECQESGEQQKLPDKRHDEKRRRHKGILENRLYIEWKSYLKDANRDNKNNDDNTGDKQRETAPPNNSRPR